MKAAVYYGIRDIRLEERPTPRPDDEHIIVRVEACSICGTDTKLYTKGNPRVTEPRIPGHEIFGVVEHVPPSVRDLAAGEPVLIAPAVGCGLCPECLTGATNMCADLQTIGIDWDGGFAEYVAVPRRARANIVKVPAGIPPEQVPLAEPLACCINGQAQVQIRAGETVAVIGMGPIGSLHVMLAKLQGATEVIAIDLSPDRLRLAEELGATQTVCSADVDPVQAVRDLTGGAGAHVVIVAAPVAQVQAQALEMCRRRGRLLLFAGLPKGTTVTLDTNLIHYGEIRVAGAHASTAAQNALALHLIASGAVPVGRLVTSVLPLDQVQEAFERASSGSELKVVVRPQIR
ncbi:MAG: alcohol dehydrogenase catalytic domain-containing protein [Firmicutes bacterium]|uniref:zinc-dependent dehydrogenase n=2 Tax=Limnochordaceae TaxID=1676650 RepID=UPI001809615B|nr:zinc-dependent dehydrogenase [Limnochorda pilosa]NMA70860.1 alcohol dehydrogenase catalytic domain-containing protein [Bacillota bacterium]